MAHPRRIHISTTEVEARMAALRSLPTDSARARRIIRTAHSIERRLAGEFDLNIDRSVTT